MNIYTNQYTNGFRYMRITEVARTLNILPDEIRQFEKKGYLKPKWVNLNTRKVRDYAPRQVRLIELIVKYRQQGYEHDTAHRKALDELQNPPFI